MRLLFPIIVILSTISAIGQNEIPKNPETGNWISLFNGKDLTGWVTFPGGKHPGKGWSVTNGILKKARGISTGNIVTTQSFTNYRLTWEWRIPEGGNSGVKYNINPNRKGAPGMEYQMLDDSAPKNKKLPAKHKTASLYDILPPSGNKKLNPAGQWNHSEIQVDSTRVQHWLNGNLVLSYQFNSPALKTAIQQSKFASEPQFHQKFEGPLMLTDHIDACEFRNIKLLNLTNNPPAKAPD